MREEVRGLGGGHVYNNVVPGWGVGFAYCHSIAGRRLCVLSFYRCNARSLMGLMNCCRWIIVVVACLHVAPTQGDHVTRYVEPTLDINSYLVSRSLALAGQPVEHCDCTFIARR